MWHFLPPFGDFDRNSCAPMTPTSARCPKVTPPNASSSCPVADDSDRSTRSARREDNRRRGCAPRRISLWDARSPGISFSNSHAIAKYDETEPSAQRGRFSLGTNNKCGAVRPNCNISVAKVTLDAKAPRTTATRSCLNRRSSPSGPSRARGNGPSCARSHLAIE